MSLPDEDVAFLDDYARTQGVASRSAALHRAVRLLRSSQLVDAYADAWHDWTVSGDEASWEAATGDGLRP